MCVLQDTVRVRHVEVRVFERERLAVALPEVSLAAQTVQLEIGPGQRDRLWCEVNPGDVGPAPGESHEVGSYATAHFQKPLAAKPIKIDQPRQVVQLVETIVIEVVKEPERPDWLVGHLQVVNTLVPVVGDGFDHDLCAG